MHSTIHTRHSPIWTDLKPFWWHRHAWTDQTANLEVHSSPNSTESSRRHGHVLTALQWPWAMTREAMHLRGLL